MTFAFFAEMAWKSALISAAALMLAYVLRSRSAADRALVLRLGVAMLLLLPLIAVGLPALQIEAWAAPEAPAQLLYLSDAQLASLAGAGLQPVEPTIWDDPAPLIILAYLGGLLMAGSRLLAGLWMLRRWTASARDVTCPEWLQAFDRVRWTAPKGDRLRLLVSDSVPSPLSWGWRDPVILIDPDTLYHPDEAEAILAHETAHVARGDWPVLMLTRLAAALFWFNPLVWLLEREVVQQAEEAADCAAADCVEPARYARTLLAWTPVDGSAIPANSIAPSASALTRRIRAILDRRLRERPSGSAWTALAMLLCIAIAAPVAAAKLVAAAADPVPAPPAAPAAPGEAVAPSHPSNPAAPGTPETIMIDSDEIARAVSAADEALAAVLPQIPTIVANATAAIHPEEMARITEEALRAARVEHRVSRAEIERAMREARREAARVRVRTVPRAEIERAVREARRETARVRVDAVPRAEIERAVREAQRTRQRVAVSMAHGAEGMLRGAAGMETGARNMEEEARRLRDRDYRERQIARAAARGETVTHEDLIEAADGLMEGAEGMREGARGMREAAEQMRSGRD